MAVRIKSITLDCADPCRLAQFWLRLTEQARRGRFGPAQSVADQAPPIERLAAFLGRPVNPGR